jgi:hypothetical protein
MADKRKAFLVGKAGKTEVRKLLRKTTDPAVTIQAFQRTHSLHTMFARAFSATPKYEVKDEGDNTNDVGPEVEALDTDSVLMFLNHLGVPQHEVHKRIADALKGSLEDEIRKVKGTQPLLHLLKSCWPYSTTVPELRPVLWAVLRQLGDNTPIPVLELLGERGTDGESLKHAEVWHPLPPLLKRLVWEADWDKYVTNAKADPADPKEYLQLVESTLFAEQLKPWIEQYVTQDVLQEAANKPFVSSQRERRLMTTQRRALTSTASAAATTTAAASAIKKDVKKDVKQQQFEDGLAQTSKAVTELRKLLSSAESPAYRPKILYAIFSILMARHGTSPMFLGGSDHLYCTLVADILLSSKVPKDYLPLKSLAQTLDEAVKIGAMTDKNISSIQASLRQIFPEEEGSGSAAASSSEIKASSAMKTPKVHSAEMKALLKRVIASGIAAMKEADPQSLFLNPVTDAIAPGYSKVIQKPMCMKQMEDAGYLVIEDWNRDVQLMFRNCIAYNSGNEGQWFRGEARRQNKVHKDDIYTQAKKLFETESAKILPPPEVQKKRKASGAGEIQPLEPVSSKKRKKVDDPYLPSMEALASMLLSDPFVIRLMLDRILKSLRIDTLKGGTLPVAHTVVPSLLQLLNLAQLSKQLCALRGKEYMVPGIGLLPDKSDPVPFQSLREYTPLLLKLFLEADLDKRMAGELQGAAQSLPERTNVIALESWRMNKQMASRLHMLRALIEGALVHVCQPGNSYENSLAHTFPKFTDALNQLASPNLWEERPFFQSLIQAILRHKSKLSKSTRDIIVSTWVNWLQVSAKKKGAMFSAAHESFMTLICEWTSLGNLLLPRDVLMKVTQEAVEATNASEKTEDRKFLNVWKEAPEAFVPIKELYQRVLKILPEAQATEWKDSVGIQEKEEAEAQEKAEEKMEVEPAEVEE